MADFPNIQGPGAPQEPQPPPAKKPERSVDSDKFHKEMHKRIEKISETDPEQQKKRKRKEEAEEDDNLQPPTTGPSTPADQVTPFSLESGKKKVSPLDMQKGGKVSPLESAQPTKMGEAPPPYTSAPPPSSISTPSPDEMEDDSGMLEESAFMESVPEEEEMPTTSYPSTQPKTQTPAPSPSPYPQEQTRISSTPPKTTDDDESSTSQKTTPPPSTSPAPTEPIKPTKVKKEAAHKEPKKPTSEKSTEQAAPPPRKEGVSASDLEKMKESRAEESIGFFEQYLDVDKEKGRKKEIKTKENVDENLEFEGAVTPITPLTPSDFIEKEKKDEEEVAAMGIGGAPAGLDAPTPPAPLSPAGPINPYANLHPEVLDVFERMVGVMTVTSMSGVTETTFTLDNPKFATSVFFGSQIIIKEYTSAPLAYNIQINGSPQALAMIQGSATDLMAAFQHGNYNFRVNRLDAGLLSEKPLFKRKQPPSGGGQDQRGSNQ